MSSDHRHRINELIEKHRSALRGHIASELPSWLARYCSTDDLLQETCLHLLRFSERYVHRGSPQFLRYAYTAAYWVRNEAIDRFKSADIEMDQYRTPTSGSTVENGNGFSDRYPSPSSHAARGEREWQLWKSMAMLPTHYRRILRLYRIVGLPLTDVAAELDITKQSAHGLIKRAEAMLREGIPNPWPTK